MPIPNEGHCSLTLGTQSPQYVATDRLCFPFFQDGNVFASNRMNRIPGGSDVPQVVNSAVYILKKRDDGVLRVGDRDGVAPGLNKAVRGYRRAC